MKFEEKNGATQQNGEKVSRVQHTDETLEGLRDFDDFEESSRKKQKDVDEMILLDPFQDEQNLKNGDTGAFYFDLEEDAEEVEDATGKDDALEEDDAFDKTEQNAQIGDQVEAAMQKLVSDTVGHIPNLKESQGDVSDLDEDEDEDEYENAYENPDYGKKKKKKGKGKGIAAAVVVLALAGGAFYGSKVYHYQNYFLKGTTINGVDCSDITAEAAEKKLASKAASYQLNLTFRNGENQTIAGSEIDYHYAADGSVKELLKKQNAFGWILANGSKEKQEQADMEYSQEKLDALLNGFTQMQAADGEEAAADAYLTFENNQFEIVSAVYGNSIDTDHAKKCIKEALDASVTELNLEEEGAYAPAVTEDDKTLNAQKDQLNDLAAATITYTLPGGTTQTLDGNVMKDWLTLDADGTYTKDEKTWDEHVKEYVAGLAAAIDNNGTEHTFPATGIDGGVQVKQEGYGWLVDQEKEIAKIEEEVSAHANESREPIYASKEFSTENYGFGNSYVEVDISRQHIWLYKDGNLVMDTDCVSGLMEKSSYTVPGIFQITEKTSPKTLHGPKQDDGTYAWETELQYWMAFNGEIGFYDASWRDTFGGTTYLTSGSRGAVALSESAAKELYENVDEGTPVIVYYSEAYEVAEDSTTETKVEDTTENTENTTQRYVEPTQEPTYDDEDDYVRPSAPEPTERPSTPEPTERPSTPEPTVAPSTPEPTETPSTPEPTETPSTPEPTVAPTETPSDTPTAPDQERPSGEEDNYPGKGEE